MMSFRSGLSRCVCSSVLESTESWKWEKVRDEERGRGGAVSMEGRACFFARGSVPDGDRCARSRTPRSGTKSILRSDRRYALPFASSVPCPSRSCSSIGCSGSKGSQWFTKGI